MHPEQPGDLSILTSLIREIRVGLLTTQDAQGHFHTRPVETLQVDDRGSLWFFTDWSTPKVGELKAHSQVSVGYADIASNRFAVVSGSSQLLRNTAKARELWSASQLAYYPDGPEDPRLAILRVEIERAEYWLAPGRAGYLIAAVRAALTGQPAGVVGENHKIERDS